MDKNDTLEIRLGVPFEIRETEDGGIKVSGYAAVFGERTDIGGWFTEEIAPGAFSDAIGRDDVVFLINHEGLPLARTRSGTLKLEEDKRGLRMETELDGDDPDVRSIVGKMKRGDLDKMSFAFIATRQEWDDTKEPSHRTILEAELRDVSIVTFPAYEGTDIGLRADAGRQALKKHQKEQKRKNFDATRARKLREKEADMRLDRNKHLAE